MALGIVLITKGDLGTSPISSVPLVTSTASNLSFGQTTYILNVAFILCQWFLLQKDFLPVQWLQLAINLLFSSMIDIATQLLSFLKVDNLFMQLLVFLLGCASCSHFYILHLLLFFRITLPQFVPKLRYLELHP